MGDWLDLERAAINELPLLFHGQKLAAHLRKDND